MTAQHRTAAFLSLALAGALVAGAAAPPAKPPELIVWSGARPAGETWAKLGPKGGLAVRKGAGLDGGSALVLRFDGDGWRGAGINWKGWHPPGDDVSRYNALVFYIRQATKVAGADLTVQLVDSVRPASPGNNALSVVSDGGVPRIDGSWRRVVLPLKGFTHGKPLQLSRLWEIDFSDYGNKKPTFHIDRIGFTVVKFAAPRFAAGPPYKAKVRLLPGKGRQISEGIYGVCGLPEERLKEYRIPVTRWGGNPSSRYNWKLNVDNGAADWFFKNRGRLIKRPEDGGYVRFALANQKRGATSYLTVPMLGWVARDDRSYGFSAKKYGTQNGHEPGHPDVGTGVKPDGLFVKGNDPRDTSVAAPPEFIAEGVRLVVKHAGKAGKGGVKYWVLDNEPMLWHATHRDVHPKPLSYDDLWERTVRYAEAIKGADPTARVAGFCSWGWTDLFFSAADAGKDNYTSRPDFRKHGNVPLAEWFIKKCGEYRRKHRKPLVDVFDFHWYPQAQVKGRGPYLGKGMDPALNALRLRTTRDLWDPRYTQESWIAAGTKVVELLPRVRKWVAKHNPGMEVCLGEYNFGGGDNITGGLAQAEVFGILAREGLDLAFLWHTPEGTQELAWRLFRSYDGKGGKFGDRLVSTISGHADLSVFAALRSADGAVTMALINKNLNGPCALTLELGKVKGKVTGWRFDQDSGGKVVAVKGLGGTAEGRLTLTLPAASATMLVLAPEGRR
jgi:hypothetical protein